MGAYWGSLTGGGTLAVAVVVSDMGQVTGDVRHVTPDVFCSCCVFCINILSAHIERFIVSRK